MRLKELHTTFLQTLKEWYDAEEINNFFFMLTEHFFAIGRVQLALRPDTEISEIDGERMKNALADLTNEKPIQYIIGVTHFYDLELEVNQYTLIPRPETEELVDWICKDFAAENKKCTVLDVGTGSGCIAISLANSLPDSKVYAVDISDGALETAYRNAKRNHAQVNFSKVDILQEEAIPGITNGELDILVSNPPYVRELEKELMQRNVLDFEPETALFVSDDNPLLFYNRIAEVGAKLLKVGGALYFEINQYLAEETKECVHNHGFVDVELKKDIFGNYRMLKALKK